MQKNLVGMKYLSGVRQGLMAVSVCSAMLLSACSMETPTQMSKAPITVSKEHQTKSYDATAVDSAVLMEIQDHYLRKGDGPIGVLVTYDPRSRVNTAMEATNSAGKIVQALRKMGATDVHSEILPVLDSGNVAKVEFNYDIYEAHAPENCALMNGIDDKGTHVNDQYMYGCSHDILLARQISNPQDLLGRTANVPSSARRHVNWSTSYNDGSPSSPLQTESTTN